MAEMVWGKSSSACLGVLVSCNVTKLACIMSAMCSIVWGAITQLISYGVCVLMSCNVIQLACNTSALCIPLAGKPSQLISYEIHAQLVSEIYS